jgi:hypothetical protein
MGVKLILWYTKFARGASELARFRAPLSTDENLHHPHV